MVVPFMDVGAKLLGEAGYSALFITWARYMATVVFFMPIFLFFRQKRTINFSKCGAQVLRALALVGATFCFFTAIQTMPLADALSIYFIYPLIMTALAPLILGETVKLIQWLFIGIGFAGVIIIVRPGFQDVSPAILYLIFGAFLFAIYHVLTRAVSNLYDHWETMAFQAIIGLIITTCALPWVWASLTFDSLKLIALIGFASVAGHTMMIKAYSYSEASKLAPFSYFEIISTIMLGLIVFNDFPDMFTLLGASIIIFSGLFVGVRERLKFQDRFNNPNM